MSLVRTDAAGDGRIPWVNPAMITGQMNHSKTMAPNPGHAKSTGILARTAPFVPETGSKMVPRMNLFQDTICLEFKLREIIVVGLL